MDTIEEDLKKRRINTLKQYQEYFESLITDENCKTLELVEIGQIQGRSVKPLIGRNETRLHQPFMTSTNEDRIEKKYVNSAKKLELKDQEKNQINLIACMILK